jgi:membrane protein CcdC involved in cytochrome C biogenesis
MILQPIFLATGLLMGFVALFWLRRTGHLRLC